MIHFVYSNKRKIIKDLNTCYFNLTLIYFFFRFCFHKVNHCNCLFILMVERTVTIVLFNIRNFNSIADIKISNINFNILRDIIHFCCYI